MPLQSKHLRIAGSVAAGLVVIPVVGQWFIEFADEVGLYQRPVERAHAVIAALTSSPWFHWIGGAVIGFFVGVWLDAFVRRREVARTVPEAAPHPETRLRLRRDPAGTHQYLEVAQGNIQRWQQVIFHMGLAEEKAKQPPQRDYMIHIDTLAITFDTPIDYERPIFETFGHEMPGYTFFSLGRSGALFQFVDALTVPVLEVRFPPVGYYAKLQEMGGENQLEPPQTINTTLVVADANPPDGKPKRPSRRGTAPKKKR